MKISTIIKELIYYDKTERPVFVTVFHRDGEGNVIKTEKYPVETVFGHNDDEASIYVEYSKKQ